MGDSSARNLDLDQEISDVFGNDETREILEKEYHVDTTDIQSSESLTFVILDYTTHQNYDRALKELKGYSDFKASFPTYKERTGRLFEHVENIIRAIKSKKALMHVPNLTASKKKELHMALSHHFQDLKASLQRITQIEYQIRIADSRSTLWVVNTFVICLFIVITFALIREAIETLGNPVEVLGQDISRQLEKLF